MCYEEPGDSLHAHLHLVKWSTRMAESYVDVGQIGDPIRTQRTQFWIRADCAFQKCIYKRSEEVRRIFSIPWRLLEDLNKKSNSIEESLG